ncbi:MAG: DEAD/DEAH box helicase [Bacillota bacterium]
MNNKNIDLLPHQKETVRRVIDEFDGKAILADEVGMGKTIEAGMIINEYIKKGEINKLLILVPASLAFQWVNEMINKFNFKNIFFNRKGVVWDYFDYQIASLDMAKRKKHAEKLKKINFDMVIVDEAHKLKNDKTLNWKFVNSLNKKYCLLLTATPIQNNLKELYNLIRILYPSKYKNYKNFKSKYVKDKYLIKNKKDLKFELNKVMIRNHHASLKEKITQREIKHCFVKLNKKEKKLYNKVTNYLNNEYIKNTNNKKSILHLLTYQREICSSSYALQKTLAKKNNLDKKLKEIYELSTSIDNSAKLFALLEIIKNHKGKKILIFTEYKATQIYLTYNLNNLGHEIIIYNGSLTKSSREWMKNKFKNEKNIMISTEAGSQGLNLQFCNIIINYDLPWHPMKLEQRIGRIDRIGQREKVYIYNLITKNTIEEKIVYLIYKKLNLLKDVIGDMDNLLSSSNKNLDSEIIKIIDKKAINK